MWKISKDTEEILYAIDYNHKRERHLDDTVLGTLKRLGFEHEPFFAGC